jgi:hypothetical protein
MSSSPRVRSRWQPWAVALAVAVPLLAVLAGAVGLLAEGSVEPLLLAVAQLVPIIPLGVGAHLAARGGVLRVRLGLAVVATWAAVFHLPALVSMLVGPLR